MIPNVLRAIGGIGVFDSISICLFIGVFGTAVFWACRLKKPFLKTMSSLPLQDDSTKGAQSHE